MRQNIKIGFVAESLLPQSGAAVMKLNLWLVFASQNVQLIGRINLGMQMTHFTAKAIEAGSKWRNTLVMAAIGLACIGLSACGQPQNGSQSQPNTQKESTIKQAQQTVEENGAANRCAPDAPASCYLGVPHTSPAPSQAPQP